ncbi:MAG: hypothetical protein WCJ07_13440 [Verrucomicrobiota bacterium]
MSAFARLAAEDRADFVREASARLDVLPVIVEKDFWVCWMLQQIFQSPATDTHLVFKGGTSLISARTGGEVLCLALEGVGDHFQPLQRPSSD